MKSWDKMTIEEKEVALKDFLHQFKCDLPLCDIKNVVVMIETDYQFINNIDIPF